MASTEEKFHAAVEIIKSLPKSGNIQPSNEMKLKFYSFFKQATEGPCELPKPGFWEVVNRAKWEAWNKLGNMSKEEAMKKYVEAFVEILQTFTLDDVEDPEEIYNYSNLMGPYIEYAPKAVQENYKLMNGKAKQSLNNNSEDHVEANHSSNYSNPSKDYKNDISNDSDTYPAPINGHNLNGNNDSDSDEFSDTLDRVNEDDPPEVSLSHGKSVTDDNPLADKGPSIVSVRGGGDHRVGPSEGGSPAGGPSGNRGNRLPHQQRSSNYPLLPGSNNQFIGGAGGNRRSGGDGSTELAGDVGEQLAMAVIRLQHIMEQVVVRLDSLEVLLTERRVSNSMQVSARNSSRWSFFGISPKLAIVILAWPFIAQWLMHLIRRRQRYM
ncbi:acyl-CoA-binding domain-containing protein 5 [Trichonephila clavata]|uniref:Acyl-CoA-binding domain-containing protein 5 n=1 Tax=Trichonephila clavata TaxID=2740835 RepID=A0A8X6LMQ9_TRICU|nr:acyl-CoA-binding domain-containing protein 5 [Trichonephila clavata]